MKKTVLPIFFTCIIFTTFTNFIFAAEPITPRSKKIKMLKEDQYLCRVYRNIEIVAATASIYIIASQLSEKIELRIENAVALTGFLSFAYNNQCRISQAQQEIDRLVVADRI